MLILAVKRRLREIYNPLQQFSACYWMKINLVCVLFFSITLYCSISRVKIYATCVRGYDNVLIHVLFESRTKYLKNMWFFLKHKTNKIKSPWYGEDKRCILHMGLFTHDTRLLCKMYFVISLISFLFNTGSLFVSPLNLFTTHNALFHLSSSLMYYWVFHYAPFTLENKPVFIFFVVVRL